MGGVGRGRGVVGGIFEDGEEDEEGAVGVPEGNGGVKSLGGGVGWGGVRWGDLKGGEKGEDGEM